MRSKISTSNYSKTRTLPKVFTEQGVYMWNSLKKSELLHFFRVETVDVYQRYHCRLEATVLKSKVATEVTINIMRIFTKLREFSLTYKDIIIELKNLKDDIKLTQNQTSQNSEHIKTVFEILSQILEDSKNTQDKVMGLDWKLMSEFLL